MAKATGYQRRIHDIAWARLSEEPLLLLQGPRTVGKTYILHQLARAHRGEVIDLDDPPTRDAVRTDAATFVSGSSPIFVDEYQHEPAVLAAIKAELNNDLRPGRFVLAGSTRSTAVPEVAEYLAGRVSFLAVLPLSQGEIDDVRENFVETLMFGEAPSLVTNERSETARLNMRGASPQAACRSPSRGAGRREAGGSTSTWTLSSSAA